MRILYTLAIGIYRLAIAIASLFNEKAKLWQRGRKQEFERLCATFKKTEHPIWIHSASLGEYEQAKPIIERIKKSSPNTKVLVTFFSPSGYEIRKNDPLPDNVFYLPMDFPKNVRRFLEIVKPQCAIFVKYEFWFNYLYELGKKNIPFYFVCAIFRPTQYFFKPWGRWFAKQLQKATFYFVQNEESKQLLKNIDIQNVEVCGDTRFDRVYAIANQSYLLNFVDQFKQQSKLIVAGSSWAPDEQLLADVLNKIKGYKLIVAPHEIHRKGEVLHIFKNFKTICYSEIDNKNVEDYDVLIIDTIGLLSRIYRYSTLSYIGGAFKTGLHNILEAAVFGVPLFYGPHYSHFNEAVMLVKCKGAFSITKADQMVDIIRHFETSPVDYDNTCAICRQYVEDNVGVVDKIYGTIFAKSSSFKK